MEYIYERKCDEVGCKPSDAVRKLISKPDVTELDLHRVYLGTKGISAVVGVLKHLKSLQVLNLRNCQLTNDVVVALAEICRTHPSVTSLDVSHNAITLPAAKALLDLALENPNVNQVLLEGTDLSEHYIERITTQVLQNTEREQPRKDNVLIDEESRTPVNDLEEWEWDSNCEDQAMVEEEAGAQQEEAAALWGTTQALPYDPEAVDDDEPPAIAGNPGMAMTAATMAEAEAEAEDGGSIPGKNVLFHWPVLQSPRLDSVVRSVVGEEGSGGGCWTDPHFPPDANSLYTKVRRSRRHHRSRGLQWRRLGDVAGPNMTLFGPDDTPDPSPPVRGRLADTWFVSACAVIATYPGLLRRLFIASYPAAGIYQLQFCKCGQWMKVVIDDWMPCTAEGELWGTRCVDPTQTWVVLLEKAYAKLHGGYDRLELGSSTQALADLTGGECRNLVMRTLVEAKEIIRSGVLADTIQRSLREHAIVCCSYRARDRTLQLAAAVGNGVYPNHLYGVTQFLEVDRWRLTQLYDPWRQAEWGGRFCLGAPEWEDPQVVAAGLTYTPEDKARGIVWIALEDLATFFNKFYCCRLFGPAAVLREVPSSLISRWQAVRLVGEWVGRTAGGRFREQNWTENPQYLVRVQERHTRVLIKLNQLDARLDAAGAQGRRPVQYGMQIGFYVLRTACEGRKKKQYTGLQDTLQTARFVASREVSVEVTLQRDQRYIIIPCTAVPNQEGRFGLACWADSPISVTPVEDLDHEYRAKGWWRRDTAGGRITGYDTWVNNPQFYLRMKQDARACITLHQHPNQNDDPLYPIAYYVFRCEHVISQYDPKVVVGFVDFLPYKTVFREFDLTAGGYIIIPMTWSKAQETTFELTVYTTSVATVQKIQRVVEQS